MNVFLKLLSLMHCLSLFTSFITPKSFLSSMLSLLSPNIASPKSLLPILYDLIGISSPFEFHLFFKQNLLDKYQKAERGCFGLGSNFRFSFAS